ncbi:MAG: tRNA (adenine-N1)-methyltransferase [Caldilineaceae bacterium]
MTAEESVPAISPNGSQTNPPVQNPAARSPWFREERGGFRVGDTVMLITADQSRYLLRLRQKDELHTHQGIFPHATILETAPGATLVGLQGHLALALEPSLDDLMRNLRRGSQIIYPKDAAWLVHRMSLHAGSRVIEAGTGSGGLTTALAWAVAPMGVVYTYEVRLEAQQIARNNLERVGLLPYVQMFDGDIRDGFRQQGVDALFLDVREPWHYLAQVRASLRPGGYFAALLPTTNQVSNLLEGLEAGGFAEIGVEELLLRRYKPVPDRFRPEDTMPAHTGYLIFARLLANEADAGKWLSRSRQRFLARRDAEERYAAEAEARDRELGDAPRPKYPPLPLP